MTTNFVYVWRRMDNRRYSLKFHKSLKPCQSFEDGEDLILTGSQVNLSDRNKSYPRCSRPSSAFTSFNKQLDIVNSVWGRRPMSADDMPRRFDSVQLRKEKSDTESSEYEIDKFSHIPSCYTAASSTLLQTLIREPWNSDSNSETSRSDKSLGERRQLMAKLSLMDEEPTKDKCEETETKSSGRTESTLCLRDLSSADKTAAREEEMVDIEFKKWFPREEIQTECDGNRNARVRFLDECVLQEDNEEIEEEDSEEEDNVTPRYDGEVNTMKTPTNSPTGTVVEIPRTPPLIDLTSGDHLVVTSARADRCSADCPFTCKQLEYDPPCSKIDENVREIEDFSPDSTLEEIVNILNVLEQEEAETLLDNTSSRHQQSAGTTSTTDDNRLKEILSYLDEVERGSERAIESAHINIASVQTTNQSVTNLNFSNVPRLEELLNKSTVELAQEILSLKLRLEDNLSGLKLLQQTLGEQKEQTRVMKLQYEQKIEELIKDSELSVRKQQKMTHQLIQEKKSWNDKVSTLVAELKSSEERHLRNLKTIEERHRIEIQTVKDTQAAAEKLKRERWIDTKAQKIKEMTVKGLEPELARMGARQQEELADLRALHKAELEAVELKAARKTTELLDHLRGELTKDKEEAIQRELSALRIKFEKQIEEIENRTQHESRLLKDEVRREKERLSNLEVQLQDNLLESRRNMERERDRDRENLKLEHQENIEQLHRRYQNELKSSKETSEMEKEAWMNNYKKQQTTKFLEREAELHHQYKRERDRDIELVIERLENEAAQARLEHQQATDNKLKRLKDKYETEIKELEESENLLKMKLSEMKHLLCERDDDVTELKTQLKHLQTELCQLRKLCEEMSGERKELKVIIRKEFEDQLTCAAREVEQIKHEMNSLKTSHAVELARRDQVALQAKVEAQQELNQVYSRVKLAVGKKDEALDALREQHKAALERCSHLEQVLDQQRRNFLLK